MYKGVMYNFSCHSFLYIFMLSFHEMLSLMEQDPIGGPMPPPGGMGPMGGAPPMPPGGGMGPMGGGAPPMPMGGAPPMPGAPPMGGGVEPLEMKPSDVWHVLKRILEGKPIDEKKSGRQQGQDNVNLGQPQQPEPSQPPPTAGPPSMGPPPGPMPAAQPQQMMGVPM
jgi:hypothetical protein